MALVCENALLFHESGKPERVLPHELLGEVGIAGLKRADNGQVLADRQLGLVILPERHGAHSPDMNEQVPGRLHDEVAAAELDDRLVEGDIGFRIFVHLIGQRLILELLEKIRERV